MYDLFRESFLNIHVFIYDDSKCMNNFKHYHKHTKYFIYIFASRKCYEKILFDDNELLRYAKINSSNTFRKIILNMYVFIPYKNFIPL
jgi:hypothetical protein